MRAYPYLIIGAALVGFGLSGCSETPNPTGVTIPERGQLSTLEVENSCGVVLQDTLFAGQFINVGMITVSNNQEVLGVEIEITEPGWAMTETHVAIEDTFEDLPMTGSGNPQVGHFEFSDTFDQPTTSWAYVINLAEYGYAPGIPLYIAVQAEVSLYVDGVPVQNETAWGDGEDFPGNSWATYCTFSVQNCDGGPEVTITSPTGSPIYEPGDTIIVSWDPPQTTPVAVELYNNGALVETLTYTVMDETTTLPFLIPEEGTPLTDFSWVSQCLWDINENSLYTVRVVFLNEAGTAETAWAMSDPFTLTCIE